MTENKPQRYSPMNPRPWWHYAIGVAGLGVVGVAAWMAFSRKANAATATPPVTPTGPSSGGSSTPSSSTSGRASGNPPNPSGDPAGYNTTRYPHVLAVRTDVATLGYPVEKNGEPLNPGNAPNPMVLKVQRDYNAVTKAIATGALTPAASDAATLALLRGTLTEDGIAGKNTLNAIEIALTNNVKNGLLWQQLVRDAT